MNTEGIGSLTEAQINQINELASNENSEEKVLVAKFNGKKIEFSAKSPKVSSKIKQDKLDRGSDLAVKTLGLKDREVSPVLAQKLIEAWKESEEIFVSLADVQLLRKHLASSDNWGSTTSLDSGKGSSISGSNTSLNTLHSGWSSTSSLDSTSGSSLSGSTGSLDSPDSAAAPPVPPRPGSKAVTPPPLPPRPPENSSLHKQQQYQGSTTSLDSATGSSISGSTQSLGALGYDAHLSLNKQTTCSLSKEVTQLINHGNYKEAHRKLAEESLQAVQGNHIKNGRWKRFGYKDQVIGNVPLPARTALKIEGSYIPANKIELANTNYIAIQAPQKGFGGDIWQAAIESNSSIICDLTGENDKSGVHKGGPIAEYYPTDNKEISFANGVKVAPHSHRQETGYKKIRYTVTDARGTEDRIVRRYNYTQWPDHGVPSQKEDINALLQYIKALHIHQKSSDYTGSTLVHCTAGVGRTGTLIVLSEMYQDIESGKYQNHRELDIAVFEAIQQGRNDRGPAFVQSDSQIAFIMDIVHSWQDKKSRGEALIPEKTK